MRVVAKQQGWRANCAKYIDFDEKRWGLLAR